MLLSKIIEVEQLGILAVIILQRMNTSKTKRERKAAFSELSKLIRLSRLVPAPSDFLYLAEGQSATGTPVIIVLYQKEAYPHVA